jgi:SAM-dependent methyltransferase
MTGDELARAGDARTRRFSELLTMERDLRNRTAAAERELRDLERQILEADATLRAGGSRVFEWGEFHRHEPISPLWGADRGRCVDRYYIERFIHSHADDIKGDVLEMHDSNYTREYGSNRVVRADVLDINPANPHATLVGDLRNLSMVAPSTYDCFIMTQTLHIIYETRAVLRECLRILRPDGVLLVTLPCVSRIAPEQGLDGDFWRFTKASASRLFTEFFAKESVDVHAHGNVLVNIAFLYGLAVHELDEHEFELDDPLFPLVVTVRAVKDSREKR